MGASSSPTITGETARGRGASRRTGIPRRWSRSDRSPCPRIAGSSRSRCGARLIIMLAGVTMNALLAIVVSTGLFAELRPRRTRRRWSTPWCQAARGSAPASRRETASSRSTARRFARGPGHCRVTASPARNSRSTSCAAVSTVTVRVTPRTDARHDRFGSVRPGRPNRRGIAAKPSQREPMSFGEPRSRGWNTDLGDGGRRHSRRAVAWSTGASRVQLGGPIAIGAIGRGGAIAASRR